MAGKITGLGMHRYVGGVDISGDVQALDEISSSIAQFDQTGIDKSAYERAPGLKDGKISCSGFFNPDRAHLVWKTLPTTDVVDFVAFGSAIGDQCALMLAKQTNYASNRGASGELITKVESLGSGFGLEWGVLLTPGLRTDTSATNGTGFDTAASASFGGQAYLEVTAVTGTSVTVKIQDSADNASFADVAGFAFTAATGPTSQRLQLGATATLRRYLRVATTGTFNPTSFIVGVVKNQVATAF